MNKHLFSVVKANIILILSMEFDKKKKKNSWIDYKINLYKNKINHVKNIFTMKILNMYYCTLCSTNLLFSTAPWNCY